MYQKNNSFSTGVSLTVFRPRSIINTIYSIWQKGKIQRRNQRKPAAAVERYPAGRGVLHGKKRTSPTLSCRHPDGRLALVWRASRREKGGERLELPGMGSPRQERVRGRRLQQLGGQGQPPDPQGRGLGGLHSGTAPVQRVQIRGDGAGRHDPSEGGPLRLPRGDPARHGQQAVRHQRLQMDGQVLPGEEAEAPGLRFSAEYLRGPSGLLEKAGQRRLHRLPGPGPGPGGLREGDGLHRHRAAAGDGASAGRLLGLSVHRLLRPHLPVRPAQGLHVVREPHAQKRHLRPAGLGPRPLLQGRAGPVPV